MNKIQKTLMVSSWGLMVIASTAFVASGVWRKPHPQNMDIPEPLMAPDFALIDQEAQPLSLAALRGKVVLLDFVYTRCPGPCPILTGVHRSVRDGLSEADRPAVQLVSITLDPEHDTPAVLREYASKRRIDAEGWSFATGPTADVDALAHAYGVGSVRQPNGEIEHTVATFLIDREGRIARRYLGTTHEPDAIRADLERLL